MTKQTKAVARRESFEVAAYGHKIEYLTEEDYLLLLGVAIHREHILLLRLLWETGLRIMEALGLRYADVYPDGLNVMGKGKHGKQKQRYIPCQAPLLGELMRYRESHGDSRIFQKITTETGALYMMRRLGKLAGLPKRMHPHLFRHSFAINFIQQTGNPFALQDIGGWATMEMIKVYMRLAKEAPKEAIGKMDFPNVNRLEG